MTMTPREGETPVALATGKSLASAIALADEIWAIYFPGQDLPREFVAMLDSAIAAES